MQKAISLNDHRRRAAVRAGWLRALAAGWAAAFACLAPGFARAAGESLCAVVKIEIVQQLTLERQGFDAHMRINNGLPHTSLGNIDVDVTFADAAGNVVTATGDPNNTNALFFIRLDRMENVGAVDGTGTVAPATSADIHWLIVPARGAGGVTPSGVQYLVGATLSYTIDGETHTMRVEPDTIFVKPMPTLVLDYFLPSDVYGDDAFTPLIEAPVPFPLGVRVGNDGPGDAHAVKIESGQPRIVENERGLLIGFTITGSEVDGAAATDSLLVDFEEIGAGTAGTAHWTMECSLSGRFTEFTATFTHADELGGELTSLIESVNTHFLVHRVFCDAPGRDAVRDFLALDGAALRVYESDYIDTPVADQSSTASLAPLSGAGTLATYRMTLPASAGPAYAAKAFAASDQRRIVSATRDDGKRLSADNVWFHKRRENGASPWEHTLRLFDMEGGHSYAIVVEDTSGMPQAPVLAHIGDKVGFVGDPLGLGFLVEASDANGTVPLLATTALPPGATFSTVTNNGIAEGTFFWRPGASQRGVWPVRFSASDGALEDSELVRIYVGLPGEPLGGDGIPLGLLGWNPAITNVLATSASGVAQVVWEAVPGIAYDIYTSPDTFAATGMVWTLAATGVVAQSEAAVWSDMALGTVATQRFYKVVLAGDTGTVLRVWGVLRLELPDDAYSLVAPPLRGARHLAGAFGGALAEAWTGHDAGPGGPGTELYVLNPGGAWAVLYLDARGLWRNDDGTPADLSLPAGHAAIAKGVGGGRATFTGEVGNNGTQTLTVHPGWNLLAPSEGPEVRLSEFLAGASGGPDGGTPEAMGDQVVYWDGQGVGHWLILVDGWGPGWDGEWLDLATFAAADPVFRPGEVIFYHRSKDAMSVTR